MLYIVVGQWRMPWGFRIYRGKDTLSPADLGFRLGFGLAQNSDQALRGASSSGCGLW